MENIVSIIMPVYNGEKYLNKSIQSVIAQSFDNWELIIINDNSKDNSISIIENFMEKTDKIHLINNKKNLGPALSRNKGIKLAKGNYIAFLDCDDIWEQNKLAFQISYMENNNIDFSYSNYKVIDENNNLIGNFVAPLKCEYFSLIKTCSIGCLTVIIKKAILDNVSFRNDCFNKEDYVLWLSILKKNITAYNVNKSLACYRKSNESFSSNKIKAAVNQFKIYRKIEKISLLKSIYYFIFYSINGFLKYK